MLIVIGCLLGAISSIYGAQLGLSITSVPPSDASTETSEILTTKMNQLVANSGIISGISDRFFITATINVLQKDVLPTTPIRISEKLQINFYVGDAIEQRVFGRQSVNVVGIGQTEEKAFINAFQKISSTNDRVISMIQNSKSEIEAYYNQNCDLVLLKSDEDVSAGNWDLAIAMLASVPQSCEMCYDKANKKLMALYAEKIDSEAFQLLRKAQSVWAVNHNYATAKEAMDILLGIKPQSKYFKDADKLFKEIENTLRNAEKINEERKQHERMQEQEQRQREWELKVQMYNDKTRLKEKTIEAISSIGTAVGQGLGQKLGSFIK